MQHVNNLNFPEYKFDSWFLYTLGVNFEKKKQHGMKELSIPRELMHLVLKKMCISPESQYSKLSAFCSGIYGNRKSWIIFKNATFEYFCCGVMTRLCVLKVLKAHIQLLAKL